MARTSKVHYIGSFYDIYEGEEAVYEKFPEKRKGILTQWESAETLKEAKVIARGMKAQNTFIIHS